MPQLIIVALGIGIRDVEGPGLNKFLNAYCDPPKPSQASSLGDTWTYPRGAGSKATHEVRLVYELAALAAALDTADAFVIYTGHSRYGQGPAFGPAGIPPVPDIKSFPVNPWGIHFRMGYDAVGTECVADLLGHSVTPSEYDLPASDDKAFLHQTLVTARKQARAQQIKIKAGRRKPGATCNMEGAWREFDTCLPSLAVTKTSRGDQPLSGRHYYEQLRYDLWAPVVVGSADLDKSMLKCRLFFMASCSSYRYYYEPLARRRTAVKSRCGFLLTLKETHAPHALRFLAQVLTKHVDPMTSNGSATLVWALNELPDSGLVGMY